MQVVQNRGRVEDVEVDHVVQSLRGDRRVTAAVLLRDRIAVRRRDLPTRGRADLRLLPGIVQLDVYFSSLGGRTRSIVSLTVFTRGGERAVVGRRRGGSEVNRVTHRKVAHDFSKIPSLFASPQR